MRIFGLVFAMALVNTAAMAQDIPQIDKEARAAHQQIMPRKIILVGDSTVQTNSGWGGEFCARHLTANLQCVNLARGGRSSFSFRAEGSWALALNEMKTPGYVKTYVLIQFGHNDMPGKPGRSTDLVTEFPKFMRDYVIETKATGAIPILVTPLARRPFKDGKVKNDLEPWAEAIRKIGREENVAIVDLNAASVAALNQMGALASLELAQSEASDEIIAAAKTGTTIAVPPAPQQANPPSCSNAPFAANCVNRAPRPRGVPNGAINRNFDYTHLGEKGAKFFSSMMATELAKSVPELSDYLIP